MFFRVTNMSSDQITLSTSDGIAQLVFETVEGNVEHPYKGSFSDELDYRGWVDTKTFMQMKLR